MFFNNSTIASKYFNKEVGVLKENAYADIIIDSSKESKTFNFGVSNGLRTLQDAGFIKMEHIMDQEDTWNLYHINELSANEIITNITILK